MAGMEHIRRPGAGESRAASRPDSPDDPAHASEEERSRFRDAMSGGKPAAEKSGEHGQSGKENLFDLFGGMMGRYLDGGAVPSAVSALSAAGEAAAPANARCEELVNRILVSQPADDGAGEVRITISESWLADTEVRLNRTAGGELSVEFLSDDVDSQRLLLSNLSTLRGRLVERTGDAVTVRLSENADGGAGDGRSRNRRNLYEESRED